MATPKRVKWARLEPALRSELEDILKAHRAGEQPLAARFHPHADEFFAFLLLAFLVALGGVIASAFMLAQATEGPEGMSFLERWQYFPQAPISTLRSIVTDDASRLVASVMAAAVIGFIWVRHRGRRGLAITDHALVILRGPHLRVVPIADVAGGTQNTLGACGKRFTVLDLTMKDGGHVRLYATKHWTDAATARIAASGGSA